MTEPFRRFPLALLAAAGVAASAACAAPAWLARNAAKDTLTTAVTLIGGFENSDGTNWGRRTRCPARTVRCT
jgi:hypothetical protein